MLQAQTSTDKSHGKNSKARQVFTVFEEYKGNRVREGCEEQRTVKFTENRWEIVCLNSPVLASRLSADVPQALVSRAECGFAKDTRRLFMAAAAVQTPLYPYSEK